MTNTISFSPGCSAAVASQTNGGVATASSSYSAGAPAAAVNNGDRIVPTHDAAYWDKVTEGFDFSDADRIPYDRYNKVLWEGLMGDKPYPTLRSGKQLGRDAATSTHAWDLL